MTATGSDTRYAEANGIQLGYQTFGEGGRLIPLHGGFGSLEMFGPNVAALAEGRQVIGVDLQSHGRTHRSPTDRCGSRRWQMTSLRRSGSTLSSRRRT